MSPGVSAHKVAGHLRPPPRLPGRGINRVGGRERQRRIVTSPEAEVQGRRAAGLDSGFREVYGPGVEPRGRSRLVSAQYKTQPLQRLRYLRRRRLPRPTPRVRPLPHDDLPRQRRSSRQDHRPPHISLPGLRLQPDQPNPISQSVIPRPPSRNPSPSSIHFHLCHPEPRFPCHSEAPRGIWGGAYPLPCPHSIPFYPCHP